MQTLMNLLQNDFRAITVHPKISSTPYLCAGTSFINFYLNHRHMRKMGFSIILIFTTLTVLGQSGQPGNSAQSGISGQPLPPYKNAALPVEQRVKDLLSRMTPEEKFWQLYMIPGDLDHVPDTQYLHGIFGFQMSAQGQGADAFTQLLHYSQSGNAVNLARKVNGIQKYFLEKSRLGIPVLVFDEALHGLIQDGATAFPQAIGLAATFDTSLIARIAEAVAQETKMRGIRDILGPVINIGGDPRWGRVEETYGEDPFLSAAMGVSYIGPFEQTGIIATPKHFIANYADGGRDSYPVHLNERILEEIYFPPFKEAFQKAGARSVMTAYNSLDGNPCTANDWLLNKKLKGEWNFQGFVISDAGATGGSTVLHLTSGDYPTASAQSITNGLDVIFQTGYDQYKLFIPPFLDGRIAQQRIDDAVSRVLRAKFELGLFENPYVDMQEAERLSKDKKHKTLARQAALETIVLLKNEKVSAPGLQPGESLLPLDKNLASIAVIGSDAEEARLGGYSGKGNGKISILEGIRKKAGAGTRVLYTPGSGRGTEEFTAIPAASFKKGLLAEYFTNIDCKGSPTFTRQDETINFSWTLSSPAPSIKNDFFSARWTGLLTAPQSGRYKIGLEGNDGYRLYINQQLIIDNWKKQTYRTLLRDYSFEKGKTYAIRVEFFEPVGNGHIKLVWTIGADTGWKTRVREAVAAARQSSVAVIVTGIREGEFQDRAFLGLPGHQEEMIREIAATGKPVVVILTGGSAITMSGWLDKVPSVLDVWYPGEEGGAAVADVLFGTYNPAGRLPITFPVSEGQLPLVYNHQPTGRGDDYNDLSGLPLFPFGFGLSYTHFEYGELVLDKTILNKGESTRVHIPLTNKGKKEGDEVVQLYIRELEATLARPVLELKGFQRVHLLPGETKEISFDISPALLLTLNASLQRVTEPGAYRIMIGASSQDLRAKGTLIIK
ncbi:glycoside hydrolase family 3 C-terminal domain-containing protein [Flavitalea flava]